MSKGFADNKVWELLPWLNIPRGKEKSFSGICEPIESLNRDSTESLQKND